MKSVFYTFLFLVFSFPAGAQFSEMLDLTPEESARLDSTFKELAYIMQTDSFRNMPEQELKAIVLNTVRQVIPADKAAALEEMLALTESKQEFDEPALQEEVISFETGHPYSILRITHKQYIDIGDFEMLLYRKRDNSLTQNALDAALQQHLYTLLTEEQQALFPAYLKAIEGQKIKTQQRMLELTIPGFTLDTTEILKLEHAEGERPVGLAHQPYADQIQMRKIYRSHLIHIVSPEKLQVYDQLVSEIDQKEISALLQRDSAIYYRQCEHLEALHSWSESTLTPLLNALKAKYANSIPKAIGGKIDSLRLMYNAFCTPFYDSSYMEFRPWQLRFERLKSRYLLQFPDVALTIDVAAFAGQSVSTNHFPYFKQLRKSIISGMAKSDVESLSAELAALEKMREEFILKSKPGLAAELYSRSGPASVIVPNRILNFLLSMPEK